MKENLLYTFLGSRYSGHGFSRFDSSPEMGGILRRLCWLFASFTLAAVGLWQATLTTMDYMSYPTLSTSTISEPVLLPFPAIHICPVMPYSSDELCNKSEIVDTKELPQKLGLHLLCKFAKYLRDEVFLRNPHRSTPTSDGIFMLLDNFTEHMESNDPTFSSLMTANLEEIIARYWGVAHKEQPDDYYDEPVLDSAPPIAETDYIGHLFIRSKIQFLAFLDQQMSQLDKKIEELESTETSENVLKNDTGHIGCEFLGVPCDLKIVPHPTYRQCYVFNHQYLADFPSYFNTSNEPYRAAVVHTCGKGLKVELPGVDLDKALIWGENSEETSLELLSTSSAGRGYRVFVTDTQAAGITEAGSILTEGTQFDLRLRRTETNRLDPLGIRKCASENGFKRLFPEWTILGEYSRSSCVELYTLKRTIEECRCRPGSSTPYLIKNFQETLKDFRICDNRHIVCEEIARQDSAFFAQDICVPACKQVTYYTSLENYRSNDTSTKVDDALLSVKTNTSFSLNDADHETNYISINIFYSTLEVPVHNETYVYHNFLIFLSNIGGTLGLFFGASIITIAEFVEFGFDALIFLFRECCKICRREETSEGQRRRSFIQRLENRKKTTPWKLTEMEKTRGINENTK